MVVARKYDLYHVVGFNAMVAVFKDYNKKTPLINEWCFSCLQTYPEQDSQIFMASAAEGVRR